MTRSYLPDVPHGTAPVGTEDQAHRGPAYRFAAGRTGSSRDYHRGWTGDDEMRGGTLSSIGNFAVQNAGRFLYFNSITKRAHNDLQQIHNDLTGGGGTEGGSSPRSLARIGPPDAGDGGAVASDSFGRLPETVTKPYDQRTDPFGAMPKRGPGPQAPSQREAPPVARGVGPKSGLGSSPLDPAGRTAFPGERPSLPVQDQATSTTPGRRAPAGMDRRKLGTWANYE